MDINIFDIFSFYFKGYSETWNLNVNYLNNNSEWKVPYSRNFGKPINLRKLLRIFNSTLEYSTKFGGKG